MPQSKDPGRYPPLVRAAVNRIAELEPFTLRFQDRKEAIAFRFSIYGYRAALLGKVGKVGAGATQDFDEFDKVFPGFRFCTISLEDFMLHIKPSTMADDFFTAEAELLKLLVLEDEAASTGDAAPSNLKGAEDE